MERNDELDGRAVISVAIDDIALASLRELGDKGKVCSVCDAEIIGEPAGSGLLMWTRGDDIRYDEPPICDDCSKTLHVTAYARWQVEYDDEE